MYFLNNTFIFYSRWIAVNMRSCCSIWIFSKSSCKCVMCVSACIVLHMFVAYLCVFVSLCVCLCVVLRFPWRACVRASFPAWPGHDPMSLGGVPDTLAALQEGQSLCYSFTTWQSYFTAARWPRALRHKCWVPFHARAPRAQHLGHLSVWHSASGSRRCVRVHT